MNPLTAERHRRCVLVDDDPRLLKAMQITLESMLYGWSVEPFEDAHVAFLATFRNLPDIFVTDYHMPDCTGSDLARALRKAHGDDCPPLVLLSGAATIDRADRSLFDAVYEKPIPARHLARHLFSLSRRSRSETIRKPDV